MPKLEDRTRKDTKSEENYSRPENQAIVKAAPGNKPSPRADTPLKIIRDLVGQNFILFLQKLRSKNLQESDDLKAELEATYSAWAELFHFAHKNFAELWDLLNLIEKDSQGWFRVSPKGNNSFISINDAGYSFSAGIEKNHSKGAPMPSKFIVISLAHSDHWSSGIGDERILGRPEPINDKLVGIKACHPKDYKKALQECRAMLESARQSEVIIQIFSEKTGQKGVRAPLSSFHQNSLPQLCKGLFLALNQDEVKDLSRFFKPGTKIELLEHSRIK